MATALPRPLSGDVDDGWQLEVGSTVTFLCACIIVGFRTLARVKYARLGWDDYLMLFALAQALVATVLDFVAVHRGLGRHLYYLTPVQRVQQEYYSLLAQVFCVNALTFAKISICLSYLRVLRGSHKKHLRWVCYTTAVLVFAVNTVVIISFYGQCHPPAKAWNPKIPGKCWKPPAEISLVLLQGSFSALTDFFLSALPLFMFKDLKVGRKSKAVLCGLMGLGTITGIFAIVRTAEAGSSVHSPSQDSSFTSILGLMWAGMERNIAIMAASVPAMRPLAEPFIKFTSRTWYYRSKPTSDPQSYEMGGSKRFQKIINHSDRRLPAGNSLSAAKAGKDSQVVNISQERILPVQTHEHV